MGRQSRNAAAQHKSFQSVPNQKNGLGKTGRIKSIKGSQFLLLQAVVVGMIYISKFFWATELRKCSGNNTREWGFDAIFDVECTRCGRTVELFKDEITRNCPR